MTRFEKIEHFLWFLANVVTCVSIMVCAVSGMWFWLFKALPFIGKKLGM